jgi:xylan 1,4-beta-xylosidase
MLQFSYRLPGGDWQNHAWPLRCHQLSDEYCDFGHFTGAFVGFACQDLAGQRRSADFKRFLYRGLD